MGNAYYLQSNYRLSLPYDGNEVNSSVYSFAIQEKRKTVKKVIFISIIRLLWYKNM